MTEPYLAEVRMFGFNFPPRGWAQCDGQTLSIDQNQALYSLLGTAYGGDGRTVFNLPDLRGRAPAHVGDGNSLGAKLGAEAHTLSEAEAPAHTHNVRASSDSATAIAPAGNLASTVVPGFNVYGPAANLVSGHAGSVVDASGGGQSHNNMQPYLAVNFCIAISGTFPPRN